MASKKDSFYSLFDSLSSFSVFKRRDALLKDSVSRNDFLSKNVVLPHQHVSFQVSRFRSGEMTGAYSLHGSLNKIIPEPRCGNLITEDFTKSARIKIRRAVENSDTTLKYFCTLTFSPSSLHEWEKNTDGTVIHSFAKYKLKKFLDTCSHKQKRLNRRLNYLWVAELQKNGNIHFHIMWDQFFDIKWLSKIWKQGNNAVDIELMNNSNHACNYIRKYMTKDELSEIHGNRYFISAGLRETMKPKKKTIVSIKSTDIEQDLNPALDCLCLIKSLKDEIELRGGTVLDFGFNIPAPRNSKEYVCKKTGETKKTKYVDPLLSKQIFNILNDGSKKMPF